MKGKSNLIKKLGRHEKLKVWYQLVSTSSKTSLFQLIYLKTNACVRSLNLTDFLHKEILLLLQIDDLYKVFIDIL